MVRFFLPDDRVDRDVPGERLCLCGAAEACCAVHHHAGDLAGTQFQFLADGGGQAQLAEAVTQGELMRRLDRILELASDVRAGAAVGKGMDGATTGVLREFASRFVGDLPVEGQVQAARPAPGFGGHAQRGRLAGAGIGLDLDGATGAYRLDDLLLLSSWGHAISISRAVCSGSVARTRRRIASACARDASDRRSASPLTLSTM